MFLTSDPPYRAGRRVCRGTAPLEYLVVRQGVLLPGGTCTPAAMRLWDWHVQNVRPIRASAAAIVMRTLSIAGGEPWLVSSTGKHQVMGGAVNPTLKWRWADIGVAAPDAKLVRGPQANLMAAFHADLLSRLGLLRQRVEYANTDLPADLTAGAVVIGGTAGATAINLPQKRAQVSSRRLRVEVPGARASDLG